MAEVALAQVTKRYGDAVAVDRLDLEVADGEFLVVLGPSGSGKSTVLRVIAGLEEPSTGTVRIGDRVVNGIDPARRDVAMVFQSYALYPHLSVRRNIAFPLGPRGVARGERERMVRDVAALLGLEQLLDRKPGQLSGGQRQRVALARAIVRRPQVFLMDEPLSNLDARMRTQTRAELVELHRRLGATVVYVTHDQVEAMTMADRVAVMDGGRLRQVGPPQSVYERPADVVVAGFLGSPPMNLLAGVLDEGEVLVGNHRLGGTAPGVGCGAVVVGIRPERLRIAPEGIPAEVGGVESLGHERLVRCRVGGAEVVARQDASNPVPVAGECVHLVAEPTDVHLFDPASGERIDAG